MINIKNKRAFSMVTAIFVIVIMASISILIMNVTGRTIKATTLQYQKEQAQLLARSYTELAILKVLYYDRNSSCLNTFSDTFGKEVGYDGYEVKVNIKYIGNNTLLANCGTSHITSAWADNSNGFNQTISLIIDTFITYKDFDDPPNMDSDSTNDRNITFHRRTLQKI